MKDLNWNIFKVKFNGKERNAFESLSYQLFCAEHNNKIGLFRFKNQAGIETEPIQTDSELIGFQAKYYETKIAENKEEIIDSIKKAKGKNPNLNKIFLYINQEISESSTKNKKDPQYKIEIEKEASDLNLNLEWRVPSHFERQLGLPENQYLADFFFGEDKNAIDFVEELKNHTENLLFGIQTDIVFNQQIIKIDRQEIIDELNKTIHKSKPIILCGEGGCGKTAVIKDFYNQHKDLIPVYIFKAIEFNVKDIKSLFKNYGDFLLQDFIKIHAEEQQKIVVIDSAERISDLEYQETFNEFLKELLKNSWTIIFTTRLSYLDDLRFQFLSIYRLPFEQININILSEENLEDISTKYTFELPDNIRMRKIIRNPFYLDEYLRGYTVYKNSVLYEQFKEAIWLRKIQNSTFKKGNIHILRENCFLNIVKLRSLLGTFYVKPTDCSEDVLALLLNDDIIGYDKNSGGYFITHDIYEEWGLNMLIERAFNNTHDHNTFLNEIGTSLIVRRAFRQWLSDKLIEKIDDVKSFIENAFENNTIATFWKDEILTSVLLSDYSEEFFIQFGEKIMENDFVMLKKIIFLLRITCKKSDDELSKLFDSTKEVNLNYVITKPKGKGWNNIIHLIHENQNILPLSLIVNLIPLLTDWCKNFKRGVTTREVGLLALKFYTDIQTNDDYRYSSEHGNKLINIIIQSASEIKEELSILFDEVLTKNQLNRRELHYDLCKEVIGSDVNNISIIVALPEYILKLADFFWIDTGRKKDFYSGGYGVEKYYGLNEYGHHDYFPASAYQTPIYWLLKFSFSKTIDFIIDFTNKTVDNYVKSGFDQRVHETEIIIEDGEVHKQYISECLWNMYRGIGSPVTPYLLQSIHMALEKYLLEIAKNEDSEILESWLLHLIKKSKSASITSVVSSIVLAYPNKFFNIAKILFSCSDLFLNDNFRAKFGEHQAKSIYSIGKGLNYKNEWFEDERLKTCEDNHRSFSLENLILNYQFFREGNISEEEAEKRQKEIWTIIDKFYSELPEKDNETDDDKTKKLLLARIDRRKMNPIVEMQDDKLIIDFNPEIDDELKNHSEEMVKQSNEMIKYSALKLWSTYKFDNSKKYGEYPQYENNPKLVLKETKEIIEELKNGKKDIFQMFNSYIPAYTCSALIKEHSLDLSTDELFFCKETILEYASSSFYSGYQYQIADGVEVAINALPYLIELFPEEKNEILIILLLTLFDKTPIGHYKRFCDYSIESVLNNLWRISSDDAQKIIIGYLKYKPQLNSIKNKIKEASVKNHGWPQYSQNDLINEFINSYKNDLKIFILAPLQIESADLSKYSLQDLEIAFQLVPYDTINDDMVSLVYDISQVFAKKLLTEDRNSEEERDYSLRLRVFTKLSYFLLFRDTKDVKKHILPFVNNFCVSEHMALFLNKIISSEDKVEQYSQFWIIWESFYEKMCDFENFKNYRFSEVIHNYLLAWPWWKETAKNWHSLKDKEKAFYKKAVKDIGHLPSVLDSVAKFLNEIGSEFLNEGVFWISDMIERNKTNKLETNTIYYIENVVRKYVFLNRSKVRQDIKVKNKILVILNFLIERSSVNAYLLREDIL